MEDPCKSLSAEFLRRLERIVPDHRYPEVLEALREPRVVALRVNPLRADRREVVAELEAEGFALEPVSWYADAFILRTGTKRELMATAAYAEGKIYLQDLASMVPVLVLAPRPGERVLDLAAAPGSKTTQMAALMGNSGEIVANDVSPARRFKLVANLRQQGVSIARVTAIRGEVLWRSYPEEFDRTLLDAPCSMEGMFKCSDPATYEHWSPRKVKVLARRQAHLLRAAVSATRVGGVIVYSTCTLSPEENEGVVDWLLHKEGDAVELEPVELPGLELWPGLASWQGRSFDPRVSLTARILPSRLMEGFFVARIRKVRSNLPARGA